jgi:hypothetical protein
MNKISRRDFLKGLLALSATTAIGLPTVGESLTSASFTPGLSPITFGRLGALKLVDRWFPLENAAISMWRRYEPLSSLKTNRFVTKDLVDATWTIEFDLRDDPYFYKTLNPLDFVINAKTVMFKSKGSITSISYGTPFDIDNTIYSVIIEGDGKLIRI